jgi:hypothetical protein
MGQSRDTSDDRQVTGVPDRSPYRPIALSPYRPIALSSSCNRCGFDVPSRAFGCKNPCPNCGTVYPLGDCSD